MILHFYGIVFKLFSAFLPLLSSVSLLKVIHIRILLPFSLAVPIVGTHSALSSTAYRQFSLITLAVFRLRMLKVESHT